MPDKIGQGAIYIITNLINGKQYVGQTTRKIQKRIYEHKVGIGSPIIYKAVKKYDIENFKWISFSCPEEDLDWQERFLIRELNTLVPNGYNLETGGNKNKHISKLTKQKMSENHWDCSGENHPMFGKKGKLSPTFGKHWHHSKETKKKMKKPKTEEHKMKLKKPHFKIRGENHPRAKKVILISPKNKKYELLCYKPFCKKYKLSASCICQVLQGKRKFHKGWTGRYLNAG